MSCNNMFLFSKHYITSQWSNYRRFDVILKKKNQFYANDIWFFMNKILPFLTSVHWLPTFSREHQKDALMLQSPQNVSLAILRGYRVVTDRWTDIWTLCSTALCIALRMKITVIIVIFWFIWLCNLIHRLIGFLHCVITNIASVVFNYTLQVY